MGACRKCYAQSFRSIDGPEDKALKAATALGKRDDDVSSGFAKPDVEIASIKSDVTVLKWMSGFTLAFLVMILARMLVH